MNAIRKIYEDLPEVITVPDELRHKKVEVILFPLEDEIAKSQSTILNFAGGAEKSFSGKSPVDLQRDFRNEWS